MFEAGVTGAVGRLARPGARWLSTGPDGGFVTADDAVNLTVPEGFDRTDLAAYVAERRAAADCPGDGPALLTGVEMSHAAGTRAGAVTVLATAGLSNPATLPVCGHGQAATDDRTDEPTPEDGQHVGTVNCLVGTTRSLADGTLASLLATVVEAKTATLQQVTGFTGTTSDAVAVGCDSAGPPARFAGSGTDLGTAARACVRDAVAASLASRYPEGDLPETVADAEHGTVTDAEPTDLEL
jgi:adenosylcobinamide hydrolase